MTIKPRRIPRAWSFAGVGIALIGFMIAGVEYPWKTRPVPIASRYPQSTLAMRTPGRLRVLFVGNSLTEYNGGLALAMEQLAVSAGKKPAPVFDEITKFGATWAQLWDVTQAPNEIREGGWDYIVLQDYSTAAMTYRSEMDVYGRRFSQAAKSVGARPVFFITWPHENQLFLQKQIAGAYIAVANQNDGLIAPVGPAWMKVLKEHPYLPLYDPRDNPKKHPTPAGTYLTACVFYSIFFHQSPHGLTGRIVEGTNVYINLSPVAAAFLQDAAWATVQQTGALASTRPTTAPTTKP
jgi:hypothetical protein